MLLLLVSIMPGSSGHPYSCCSWSILSSVSWVTCCWTPILTVQLCLELCTYFTVIGQYEDGMAKTDIIDLMVG